MAVTELASINNSVAASDEFTPNSDFLILVKKGSVSLAVKLPGEDEFYLASELQNGNMSPVSQSAPTITKVSEFVEGSTYKLIPQSKFATAKAVK